LCNFSGKPCTFVLVVAGDNLFIGSEGQLKIGDFGHAQDMVDGVVYSYMEGTVYYMAPEVSMMLFVSVFCKPLFTSLW